LTARDVGDVVGRLRAAGIDFWVEGGWGVDALLGEQTRPHDDLDLGVRSEQLPRLDEALAGFRRSDVEWPSAVVYEDDAGRRVDAHPLMFDASGDGWQANAFGGAPHRWPCDGLTGRGRIEDLDVPCITPNCNAGGTNTRSSTTSTGVTSAYCAGASDWRCRRSAETVLASLRRSATRRNPPRPTSPSDHVRRRSTERSSKS
jgi:lincosamide nucleotidyltransferase A/C/D/E